MAQGLYKSGEIINLTYQAIGCLSNALPTCKVFDESGASDLVAQSALHSALSAGQKTGGRYHGHFTPDAEGRWTVCIKDKNGDGEVTKTYNVCGHNIDEVGDDAALAKNYADSATNAGQSALAKATSADSQATIAATKAATAATKATSAADKSDSALNKAASALAKATSALAKAASAAGYGASAATSAAVAAIASPAMVS